MPSRFSSSANRCRFLPSITRTARTISDDTARISRVAPTCAVRPSFPSATASSNWSSIRTNSSSTDC
jgi:hypothetical protein